MEHFGALVEGQLQSQYALRLSLVACAVERFRLAEGRWPSSPVEVVTLGYVDGLPSDLAREGSFVFERTDYGVFLVHGAAPVYQNQRQWPPSNLREAASVSDMPVLFELLDPELRGVLR
jgi:hypothetical protein